MARTRKAQDDHFHVGIRLLECLVRWPTSRGVTQLAEEVGLAASSTHDLLKILCDLGFAQHDPESRKYAPSPRMFEFINFFTTHFGITPKIQEMIFKRSAELGMSIFLGTVWQAESYVVCTSGPLGGVAAIGSHGPVYFTAIGKCILAEQPREKWEQFADQVASAKLSKTAKRPTREEFLRELDRISQSKVAWNIFNTEIDILSVATAIKASGHSRQYAIALVFTREMYYLLDRPKMEETVKEMAALIERAIAVKVE
jgi:DNA-binding IclR family transcriptional regulator